MKKQIITTITLAILATGIIFSCKKKDETTPEDTNTTTTTTTSGSTTSGGTTGGTTGSNTNTLALNTWSVKRTNNVTYNYTVAPTSFTSASSSSNQITYQFEDVAIGSSLGILNVVFSGTNTPTSGYYALIDGIPGSTVAISSNQARISIIGSQGGNAYSQTTLSAAVSLTNTGGSIIIDGLNVPLKSAISTGIFTLNCKVQK